MITPFPNQKPIIAPSEKNDLFTDLSPFLAGEIEQELPTVAETFNGKHLFYAGRLNELHAEPGLGKSNILLASSIAVMKAEGSVIYIDPEDTPAGFVRRLRLYGAGDDLIREIRYLHNPSPEKILEAQAWANDHHTTMVVLDGLAESLAAVDMVEDKAGDILKYFRDYLRPFTEAGAAVVIADHVTKSVEGRGQFARGSGAKAGRYDGVSYEIVSGKPYAPGAEGFVKLKVAKDRNGGVGPRGKIAAELHFIPNASGGTIGVFREPTEKQEGPWKPTAIMENIVKHLEGVGEATATDLRGLKGKTEYISMAIECLKEDGIIDTRREGNKTLHFLLPKTETA